MARSAKPLFIPLKAQYYDAFASGEKRSEFRAHGPRWNSSTCWQGREVILSRGYGKKHRMSAKILSAGCVPTPHPAFIAIYGTDRDCWCINLTDIKPLP